MNINQDVADLLNLNSARITEPNLHDNNKESLKEIKKTFNYRKDFKCIKECTSFYFGTELIKQICFVCPICNPNRDNKLCKYCYLRCHMSCREKEPLNSEKLIEAKNELKNETFACYCGLKLKHQPDKQKEKELIQCNMLQLDQALKSKGCWCKEHAIQICCICSVSCHKACHVNYEGQNATGRCNCKSDYHTSYNELALSFPLDKYKEKTGTAIWTIQILNILFSTKTIFRKMSELFIQTLNKKEGSIDTSFFPLLELFSNTLNRKFKTFYYDNELKNMFNYQNLTHFMFRLPMDNGNMLLARFRLLFILLFIHLKKDYQEIKTLTSIDFLTVPILERFKYKKRLFTENDTNSFILDKYFNKKDNLIKKIALEDACKLMEIGMNYLSIEENQDEFEIGLKYLCFLLKRMTFTNKELDSLIRSLFSFYENFFDYLNDDKSNIYSLLSIFNTISEIYYMIAVCYNDNAVFDYLEGNKEIKGFIHLKSESGSLLFKMVLKSCDILKKHYFLLQKPDSDTKSPEEKKRDDLLLKHNMTLQAKIEATTTGIKLVLPVNGGLIVEKIITVFNETLKLFALADNSYFKQLQEIKNDDLSDYFSFTKKINKNDYGNFLVYPETNKNDNDNVIKKVKAKIEAYLYDLFTGSYVNNNLRISNNIITELIEFIKTINNRFDYILSLQKKDQTKKKKKEKKGIKQKKIEEFTQIIINSNKKVFPFLQHELFEDHMEDLLDSFALYSLDETLTKLLVFFSNKDFPHLLTFELLEIVYAFISLFMLTRNGMTYLISGKNLTRASKIFRRYSIRHDGKNIIQKYHRDFKLCMKYSGKTLNFIQILSQGIVTYGLDIKSHKVLIRFKKNMIEHLQEIFQLKEYSDCLRVQVKLHLSYAMSFFETFSNFYEYEVFEDIKRHLSNIFSYSNLNLHKKNKFVNLFENKPPKTNSNETSHLMKSPLLNTSCNPFKSDLLMKEDDSSISDLIDFNNDESLNHIMDYSVIERSIEIKTYFSFFSIMSKNTSYVYTGSFEEEMYNRIFEFNQIHEFVKVFASHEMKLNHRTNLLAYIRSFVFIEHLDKVDLFKKKEVLTNEEYKLMIYNKIIYLEGYDTRSMKKKTDDLNFDQINELKSKLDSVNQIEQVIDIYIKELKEFPKQIINEPYKYVEEYAKEIIYGSKFIADFFYFSKNIVNKLILKLYLLTKEFIAKKQYFIKLFSELKESETINLEIEVADSQRLKELTSLTFNIYDKDRLYKYLTEDIEIIFKETEINKCVSLSNYLDVFDNMSEANFTPFSLVETYDYEYFYDNPDEDDDSKDKMEFINNNIKQTYINQFTNITQTNFYNVITTISNESVRVDYRKKIVDYFHAFLLSNEGNILDKLETLLCIINKMLFYDGDEMQNRFEKMKYDKFFFPNINNLLHQHIILTIVSTKNIFSFDRSIKYISITKLAIQFLQLLGEGFNINYHDNIFRLQQDIHQAEGNKDDEDDDSDYNKLTDNSDQEQISLDHNILLDNENQISKITETQNETKAKGNCFMILNETIYDTIINNLKRTFHLMDIGQSINCEMPYDKLIVLTTNLIDFLIEYIDTKNELKKFIKKSINILFIGRKERNKDSALLIMEKRGLLHDSLFCHINTTPEERFNYQLRRKVICYIKMKYIQLLISYLQAGKHDDMIDKLMKHQCSAIELFAEILFNFKQMIILLEETHPMVFQRLTRKQSDSSFVKELLNIYVYEKIFIEAIEFPLCMKIYILIKIYEEIYKKQTLKAHFDQLFQIKDADKSTVSFDDTDVNSEFSKRIYLFLEQVVLKVEIKTDDESDEKAKAIDQTNIAISNIIWSSLEAQKESDSKLDNNQEEDNQDNEFNNKSGDTKITFFVRPYLSFRLSNQSILSFEENVNRTNATSKFIELISFSDYSLFEMIVNTHLVGKSRIKKLLSNLTYRHFEIINYLFIVIHNILLIFHYYRSPDLHPSIYDINWEEEEFNAFPDNFILSAIQFVFLGLILLNWLYFKFSLCYQHCIMKRYNKSFIFRKKGETQATNISNTIDNYFKDMSISTYSVIKEKNKSIGFFSAFYVAFFDALLFNREICVYIYTIILMSLYIKYENGLLLIFPTIFIANINSTLFDIFQAMKMKFTSMGTVLLFTAIIVYIFMWITFFYMAFLFDFPVTEAESGMEIRESFCTSSIQCFLYIFTSGLRANAGIGEVLPMMSFQGDPLFFFIRFLYDMLFFIFIIMILFNVFMGIIVDTFAELRDINYNRENDINNVCFICQLTRDDCLTKNIDYNTHVSKEHFMWNYVYFLVYLHINNPNDFNRIENYVWGKLEEYDFGWIPIDSTAAD